MKKAADESLAGVRQKISDVNKQKKLIQALAKLRSARSHTAQQHGLLLILEKIKLIAANHKIHIHKQFHTGSCMLMYLQHGCCECHS